MSSRYLTRLLGLALALLFAQGVAARELRVCSDPDNLPFSNADGSGFENRIAQLIAAELGATVVYHWEPWWRGFVRETLNAKACDVIVGIPVDSELVRTTQPYYRSRYAIVTPADSLPLASLDDPRLAALAVGVLLPGNGVAATPPRQALARRKITRNVHGYTSFSARPAVERMIDDVESGKLDVAIVWGPQAAYFAGRQHRSMVVVPASGNRADEPLEFSIGMAVRRDDVALARELDAALARQRPAIDAILLEYRVPRTDVALIGQLVSRW